MAFSSDHYVLSVPKMADGIIEYYFSRKDEEIAAKVFPFHVHSKLEMYILLEGDVSFAVESSLYKVSHGDAIITRPNEIHNCILNSNTVHRHMCFWFDTSNDFLYGDFLTHPFGENNLIVPDAPSKARLLEIYDELDILFELIELINSCAQNNAIHCGCENEDIAININQDSVFLICKNCKKSVTLKATPEVLNMLLEKMEIIIE